VQRGQEKGFFSFGGSSIVLLFEQITFAGDLLDQPCEVYCQMGYALEGI
jgi:phosphatidylserine decarboxylase